MTVAPNQIKVTKKASEAQPGNDLELNTQGDGATVGIREAVGFVQGSVKKNYNGPEAGASIMFSAEDYTSKGDDDMIDIVIDGKKSQMKKRDIEDPRLSTAKDVTESRKNLDEVGVYNSENDIAANPKTKENKPDELTGFVSQLTDSVNGIIGDLTELKKTVEENSELSFDSLDVCIAELQSYVKSLDEESEVSSQSNPN
jgi:hypothetical protein